MALIVVIQERRYQIDIGHRASVYATNAVRPAKWKTARELAPRGSALPATDAAKIPTTTEKRNHWMRFLPHGHRATRHDGEHHDRALLEFFDERGRPHLLGALRPGHHVVAGRDGERTERVHHPIFVRHL